MRRPAPARSRFERAYFVVVLLKGVDGAVELVIGLLLTIAPTAVRETLTAIATELGEGTSLLGATLSGAVEQAADGIGGGVLALALFLVVHGVVKLLTVYALVKRLIRWYPWAIAALVVLLVVQLVDAVLQPAAGAWVLAGLDVVVLTFVVLEYRRLRRPAARTAG